VKAAFIGGDLENEWLIVVGGSRWLVKG
jgi:hypothetical protein